MVTAEVSRFLTHLLKIIMGFIVMLNPKQ